MNIKILPNERIDDLQTKGYKIIQNPERFCFGIDAVLLSTFSKVKHKDKVMDLCSGNGIIPILVAAKYNPHTIHSVEIQEENVEMAQRSIALNGLKEKIKVYCADLNSMPIEVVNGSYQVVTVNPPYMIAEHGLKNEVDAKSVARHEVMCTLENVIEQSSKLLNDKGRFYMVHKPFRLAEIFAVMMKYNIEPKRIKMVQSYVDKEPSMVLIEGIRGGKPRITVEPPLIIYNQDGSYTTEVLNWYGEMKS